MKTRSSIAYANNAAQTAELLKAFVPALAAHKANQKQSPTNWGFAGDLAHLNQLLAEALQAVGGKVGHDQK